MQMPIGCTIDRKTGERTDLYRECTTEELQGLARALLRAAEAAGEAAKIQKKIEKGRSMA